MLLPISRATKLIDLALWARAQGLELITERGHLAFRPGRIDPGRAKSNAAYRRFFDRTQLEDCSEN